MKPYDTLLAVQLRLGTYALTLDLYGAEEMANSLRKDMMLLIQVLGLLGHVEELATLKGDRLILEALKSDILEHQPSPAATPKAQPTADAATETTVPPTSPPDTSPGP